MCSSDLVIGETLGARQIEAPVGEEGGRHGGEDRAEPARHPPPSACAYPTPMPRIYTRTGDDGTTGRLYGGRISKADEATEAYGTTDEAVAALGVARAHAQGTPLAERLLELQRELFVVGAELAANPAERGRLQPGISLVTASMVRRLESLIDDEVERRPLPTSFIVPGADPVSASIDLARSIVRRAERESIRLREAGGSVHDDLVRYLNRLSDLLFVLARSAAGGAEPASRG